MMRLGITDAVKHLIIINVVVFIGMMTIGTNGDVFNQWLALYFPENDLFKPWQVVTHMFMHSNVMYTHILFNMFTLWMFGTSVERQIGTKKFLFIYFSAGFGALLFQLGHYYFNYLPEYNDLINLGLSSSDIIQMLDTNRVIDGITDSQKIKLGNIFSPYHSSMVGASGCIMGVMAAFGVMNPNSKMIILPIPIPIKAKYLISGLIGFDIISAFTGQSFFSPSNTAYAAHVGGALVGLIIMWYWKKNSMNKYRWDK